MILIFMFHDRRMHIIWNIHHGVQNTGINNSPLIPLAVKKDTHAATSILVVTLKDLIDSLTLIPNRPS